VNPKRAQPEIIHQVLLKCGVRYVGKDITKGAKTRALLYNLNFILEHPGKLKGLMKTLSLIQGEDYELQLVYCPFIL
jgi:hypothetical protein